MPEQPNRSASGLMRVLLRVSSLIHAVLTAAFVGACLVLIVIAANTGILALMREGLEIKAAQGIIEALGLITVAVAALQIAQTIAEEEVIREAHMSGPTRARRFLSRFMVVIVVALSIEGLVATFKAIRENPQHLVHAAALMASVALLLVGWALFVRLNIPAEKLEPEAMEEAKQEDQKLQ